MHPNKKNRKQMNQDTSTASAARLPLHGCNENGENEILEQCREL